MQVWVWEGWGAKLDVGSPQYLYVGAAKNQGRLKGKLRYITLGGRNGTSKRENNTEVGKYIFGDAMKGHQLHFGTYLDR